MGVEIEYTLGGRKVSRNQFFSGIDGQMREAAVDQVRSKIGRTRCPEHGQTAVVSEVRETRDGFDLNITGCCDALVQRAGGALT